jgi:hypothetical protein
MNWRMAMNRVFWRSGRAFVIGAVAAGMIWGHDAGAANVFALTNDNRLIGFDSANPNVLILDVAIADVPPGETMKAIDFRPATWELFGVSNMAKLYRISVDLESQGAQATGIGASVTPIVGDKYGLDFNPVVDRIRLTTEDEMNLRINPNTGALSGLDVPLTPAGNVVDIAYDRNFRGTLSTTVFGIDSGTDQLVRIGGVDGMPSPNGGQVTNVGAVGVNFGENSALDYSGKTLYALLSVDGSTGLYTIDAIGGAGTLVGAVAGNPITVSMAVEPERIESAKLNIKLNFAKPASDSIQFSGLLEIPEGTVVAGSVVRIAIGPQQALFTLDEKGRAGSGDVQFKLSVKSKNGVVNAQFAKFKMVAKNHMFLDDFAAVGLTNIDIKKGLFLIPITVVYQGDVSIKRQSVFYTAKQGKSGKASGK